MIFYVWMLELLVALSGVELGGLFALLVNWHLKQENGGFAWTSSVL